MTSEPENIVNIVLMGIALIVLIFLSAIFSASETSLTSVSKFKFDTYYKKKKKNFVYKMILVLINNYQMSLSTILISNTLTNVASSTLSTLFFTDLLKLFDVPDAISVATGVATGVITFLVLVFGEFLPKSIARKHSLVCLKTLSPLIFCLYYILWPLNWLLCKIVKEKDTKSATEQELDTLIDIVSNEGTLSSHEASLVSNALKFDDTRIESIMIDIDKVVAINLRWSETKIKEIFETTKYTRLPVIQNNKYIGILHLKKFFFNISQTKKKKLKQIIDPIYYVSKYDTLDKVLQDMQVHHSHLMIVKKNNNSTVVEGIVTMEDLMEKLIGQIYDENDSVKSVLKINDFTWKVFGSYNAKKFINNYLKLDALKIDEDMSVTCWLRKTLKIKRLVNDKEAQNDFIKVTVCRTKNQPIIFIIEKKITQF